MTAWIVTGCILLFFAILLFSPIVLRFSYKDGRMDAKLVYLFIRISFSPEAAAKRAEKKAARAVKDEYKKQKKEEKTADEGKKEKRAMSDTAKTAWSMLKASKKGIDKLRRHLIFYRINALIITGGNDAHQIGKSYATYCTLVPNAISLLESLFVVREPQIAVIPDFIREKPYYDISFRVRILVWHILSAAVSAGARIIKVILSNKEKREKTKTAKLAKGGKKHEPTASHK